MTTTTTPTALRALVRENSVRFPGRVRSILRCSLDRADKIAQLAEARKIHRENVGRIVHEPAFASWIADGSDR